MRNVGSSNPTGRDYWQSSLREKGFRFIIRKKGRAEKSVLLARKYDRQQVDDSLSVD